MLSRLFKPNNFMQQPLKKRFADLPVRIDNIAWFSLILFIRFIVVAYPYSVSVFGGTQILCKRHGVFKYDTKG